jgi:hypothetical protein
MGAELASELDDLVMGANAAGAAKERHAIAAVQQLTQGPELFVVGPHDGRRGEEPSRDRLGEGPQRDVARDHHDCDASLRDSDAHCAQQDLRKLIRLRHQLNVVTAFLEQVLGMRSLEVIDPDLSARDVGGDRKHRYVVAVGVEQTADEVEVAGATAAGADRQLPSEVSLGASCEGGSLLMANVDPFDRFQAPKSVGESIQRVPDNAIDALHTRLRERFGHVVCCGSAHPRNPRDAMLSESSGTMPAATRCWSSECADP